MKIIFLSDVTFPSWPGKFVNPNFPQNTSDRHNNKFDCCLKIQSKAAAKICLHPGDFKTTFKSNSYLTSISCQISKDDILEVIEKVEPFTLPKELINNKK